MVASTSRVGFRHPGRTWLVLSGLLAVGLGCDPFRPAGPDADVGAEDLPSAEEAARDLPSVQDVARDVLPSDASRDAEGIQETDVGPELVVIVQACASRAGEGTACEEDSDCLETLACNVGAPDDLGLGRCTVRAGEGGLCGRDTDCQSPLRCNLGVGRHGWDGVCEKGKQGPGGPCGSASDCSEGLRCNLGLGTRGWDGLCSGLLEAGRPCRDRRDCVAELVCRPAAGQPSGTCAAPGGVGESCSDDGQCSKGLACTPGNGSGESGTCTPPGPAGARCMVQSWVSCQEGLACNAAGGIGASITDGRCSPLAGAGEACGLVDGFFRLLSGGFPGADCAKGLGCAPGTADAGVRSWVGTCADLSVGGRGASCVPLASPMLLPCPDVASQCLPEIGEPLFRGECHPAAAEGEACLVVRAPVSVSPFEWQARVRAVLSQKMMGLDRQSLVDLLFGQPCVSGLSCNYGTGLCARPGSAGAGQACFLEPDCQTGLTCRPVSGS